ncbi:transposase [uncultured Dialister sp.]|uniref:IS1634 family transposase n=1 Tax=uncultured Dialister sp. TaxID=278064 RepID=UPI0025F76E32|nr:transposase [uncultured Dialister sp.]
MKYGKNKDDDRLPQINLALLFGQDSRLPFCYRELTGNIPDVKTLRETIDEITSLDVGKIKYCMNRGFCGADNINLMYNNHVKFLMSVSNSLSYAETSSKRSGLRRTVMSAITVTSAFMSLPRHSGWITNRRGPYKGDVLKGARRMYIRLYYNPEKYADNAVKFNPKLDRLKTEVLSGYRVTDHEQLYKKYFIISETPVRGISFSYKQDAINAATERYGFFALVSNEVKDPAEALCLYRLRDVVEKKAFGDLKERLNCRRILLSYETALYGKLFVELVALIYLSYVKKMMEHKGLFSKYSMNELLDELDLIECHKEPENAVKYGEILSKQEQIYRDLEVEPLLAKPEVTVR